MTPGGRVLLLTTDYPPMDGGISRLLSGLVHGTSDIVDWRVLTRAPRRSTENSTPVTSTDAIWSEIGSHARWLRCAEKRLVVCGHVYGLAPAFFASRLAGAPLGTIVYGMELVPRRWPHRLALAALRAGGQVVAISRHSAEVAGRLGVPGERIRVVNPAPAPPWPVRRQPCNRSPGEGLRLVMVSRLAEGYKNLEVVLRAVSVLRSTQIVSQLTVIGDGPRREALEEKARGLEVDNLVKFVGRLEDEEIGTVLANAHLGLFPSRDSLAEGGFEGFGLVVQEMASAGLPVLVGRAAGAVDAAGRGWSELLDPDDLRAWIGSIERIWGNEPMRLHMARAAIAWAEAVDHRTAAHRLLRALAG
jgi:glycosyltransferase involved in cell wall biosynthesis